MLSIIIPTYNEELALGEVLEKCTTARQELLVKKLFDNIEIIVVDDGSTDTTAVIAHSIPNILVTQHLKNKGYGAALMTGFREAHGDIIAMLDADGTYDPRELLQLASLQKEFGADMVIGNRMHDGSKMPLIRKIGNKFFAMLIRFVGKTNIKDATSGMRIFRKDIVRILEPFPNGLDFTTVMTTRATLNKNIKVMEIPISYSDRRGTSKLSVLSDGPRAFWALIKVIAAPRTT